ncbi:transforming growth factor beta receptor type 3 [Periophthalmus magnuspinnatus]|uniref:transforming growth factor beta receptor type 3 n=1 Tax=Periophthalmus magnuspinnatus TaxID=409849 RepID=UPI0024367DF4|nr:transforming growth factor beta receptor type 3 [Periophthalmus magnuspinnatus]
MWRRLKSLILLLTIWHQASAGPVFRSPCELLPVGQGHPVQALSKTFTVLAGCASKGTSGLPQEVHVVNVRGNTPEGQDGTLPQVQLHLKPIQSLLRHQKALVFVLNSPQPLTWRIRTENLAPGATHTFHVSAESQVQFQSSDLALTHSHVLTESLPHGNEHLLNWAQRKYKAITSFSELRMTQDIYIKVGEDPVFSDTCKIDTRFLSLNYLGGYVEPQPSKGCILSGPDDKEVHVIELQAPNSSSAFQVDVIVDLQPLEEDAPLHRDVVLILKCARAVNWVIEVHRVIGKLQVVASDTISIGSGKELMQVTKVPKQSLPLGSQNLIQWTEEHGYGPVTSYTSTSVANHFNLRLREHDRVDPLDSMFSPDLSVLHDSRPHHEPRTAPRLSGLPFPFTPAPRPSDDLPYLGLPPSLDDGAWDNEGPEEVQRVLNVGMTVQCEESRMVVSIDKDSLKANGFTNASITLQDPECKATVNATHYRLETPLDGCLTAVYPIQGSSTKLHINSVFVSHVESKDGSGGPLEFDQDPDSEDRLFPREAAPDRTDPLSVIMFNCSYSTKPDSSEIPPRIMPELQRPKPVNVSFSIELYNTQPFSDPSRQSFYTVSQNLQVYVQITSSTSDPDLSFTIISCLISPNSNPRSFSDYLLIETVCPTDDSVKFYPNLNLQSEKKTFSFNFNSKFNASLLFLHCEMSLCSKKSSGSLPACLQPGETCDSLSVDKIMVMMMNTKTATKPLVVLDGSTEPDITGKLHIILAFQVIRHIS